MSMAPKVIDKNGCLALGKKHAGKTVLVEKCGPGEWRIRTCTVIPDNEAWLHQQKAKQDLTNALKYAEENPL